MCCGFQVDTSWASLLETPVAELLAVGVWTSLNVLLYITGEFYTDYVPREISASNYDSEMLIDLDTSFDDCNFLLLQE